MHSEPASQRITSRFAVRSDIERYYGAVPAQTLQAIVIEQGSDLAAVIGLARHADHAQFFSEFRESLRPYLRTLPVMRAIKAAQKLVRESPLLVYAIAEETEAESARILSRLGFVHERENVYRWPNSRSSSPTS